MTFSLGFCYLSQQKGWKAAGSTETAPAFTSKHQQLGQLAQVYIINSWGSLLRYTLFRVGAACFGIH
jgi:hypothetical protein